jgi:hypothetical protein
LAARGLCGVSATAGLARVVRSAPRRGRGAARFREALGSGVGPGVPVRGPPDREDASLTGSCAVGPNHLLLPGSIDGRRRAPSAVITRQSAVCSSAGGRLMLGRRLGSCTPTPRSLGPSMPKIVIATSQVTPQFWRVREVLARG